MHIASVSSRLAGQQAAEDQQYVHQAAEDQQYISQKMTSSTSVSRGPALHQSAQEQHYISQQRTSSTSVSIGTAVLYISHQRTCGTSVSRGPAILYCASVSRRPAVYQSAEDQQHISQQRTSSTVHPSA